jgi:nucleoside-diphosphate-sugar epimerase
LIIGAGLVGSQVARIFVEKGERPVLMDRSAQPQALGQIVDLDKVTLVDGDVLRPADLTRAIFEYATDEIIHLAANPMLTIGAQKDPLAAIQLNIMGTANVLEAARQYQLKRVVVASSNVLNHHIDGGQDAGDQMCEEAFPRPISIYSVCKQAIENIGLNYARWFGVDFVALRYGAVAGPWGGTGGGGPSNLFLNLVKTALEGGEAIVPAATMEWVYSKDAARATILALRVPEIETRVFNITMGRLTSPEDLMAAIQWVLPESRLRIQSPGGPTPAFQSSTRAANLSRATKVLGYTPSFPMPEAVRDLVEWLTTKGRQT